MKKTIIYILCSLTVLLSGCFKEYEERYLFEDNRIEFEDAVTTSNTSGKAFPILGPIPAEEGKVVFRVNMTGKQASHDRIVNFRIVPEETTAVEGSDFALPHGREFTIPANSSFGYVEVELLPDGNGSPTVVLELLPTDDIKVLDRYHRIGLRYVYQMTKPDPSKIQEINDIKVYTDFVVGAQLNQNIGFLADFNTFNVYTMPGANVNQEHIDVMLLNGSTTGLNLLTPSSAGVTAFSSSSNIASDWTQRNSGTLLRISNPESAELNMFTNANSVSGLLAAYSYFSSIITTRPGYNATNDGPSERIRHVAPGDIIVYYSTERETITMFQVKETIVSNTGEMVADVKTGKFDPSSILNSGSLALGGYGTGGTHAKRGAYLVDLATIESYTIANLNSNNALRDGIDFASLWSSGGYANWFTIEALYDPVTYTGTWGARTTVIGQDWAVKNAGEFVHYENATEEEIQIVTNISTRNDLVAAFDYAKMEVVNRPGYIAADHGPNARPRRPAPGSIVFFKSTQPGRNLYAVIIVNNLTTTATNGQEIFQVFVKSHLN